MDRIFTIVASGGVVKRQSLLAILDKSGLADISEQWELNPSHGLPRENHGWITLYVDDVPACLEVIEKHKWHSRLQWNTPDCPRCVDGHVPPTGVPCSHCNATGRSNDHNPPPRRDVFAEFEALKQRLAILEGVR